PRPPPARAGEPAPAHEATLTPAAPHRARPAPHICRRAGRRQTSLLSAEVSRFPPCRGHHPATLAALGGFANLLRSNVVTTPVSAPVTSEARTMRWRLRSVRTRILLLVLVPVLSLVGIYAYAIGTTASDVFTLAKANTVKNTVGDPVAAFMSQLSTERM